MRFEVYKEGKRVEDFEIRGAYMFGTDGIAVRRAQVTFKNGIVDCQKPNSETAGLALLWPIEGFGKVLLPTTCLPEREKPYILNVEITRAKLMQIINKREDWSFFTSADGLRDIAKEANDLFVKAVQNIADAPLASKLADEALKKAIVLAEKLATKQADSVFSLRVRNRNFGRGCLGCNIDIAKLKTPGYLDRVCDLFGVVTLPVNWGQIEKEKGEYDFSRLDACLKILKSRKLAIGAGPLVCFAPAFLPKWLLKGHGSFEKVRDHAYRFISEIVGRYSGLIRMWRVVSCLNIYNHFEFTFEQILEMTRAANMAARAAGDRGIRVIEISNPWGEYYSQIPNTIPPLVYMDMVVQSGINFDAFGLKMQFGKNEMGMQIRDMMQTSAVLDYFLHLAKPVHLTDVEVPSLNGNEEYDGNSAGIWHEQWDQARQAQWIDNFYRIALSKPFVETVNYSHLCDIENSRVYSSGLVKSNLEIKESYETIKKLKKVIFSR